MPALPAGIKNLHVFPFVSQFCLMAHDMELGLAEGLATAATAAAAYQHSSSSSRQEAGGDEEQQQQQQSAAEKAAATVRHGELPLI
jgi:hypothetical protein